VVFCDRTDWIKRSSKRKRILWCRFLFRCFYGLSLVPALFVLHRHPMTSEQKKPCCKECKPKGHPGKIGTPWCAKFGDCPCHTPSLTEQFVEELDKFRPTYNHAFQKGEHISMPAEIHDWVRGLDAIKSLCLSYMDRARQEGRKEEQERYRETNIKSLVEEMNEQAEEYGQYHEEGCQVNWENGADAGYECECEIISVLKNFAHEWMAKVNQRWCSYAEAHRPFCKPEGNKMLTRAMGKKNRETKSLPQHKE